MRSPSVSYTNGYIPIVLKPLHWLGNSHAVVRAFPPKYRVFYLATRPEAVYVLHAFVKKSRRTREQDIGLGRARLKELPREGRRG